MLSISRFHSGDPGLGARLDAVLALLEQRPGFVAGRVGRAADDPDSWVLVTEWRDVGSYRRGLSSYEVKVGAWPTLAEALPEPSAFEVVHSREGRD